MEFLPTEILKEYITDSPQSGREGVRGSCLVAEGWVRLFPAQELLILLSEVARGEAGFVPAVSQAGMWQRPEYYQTGAQKELVSLIPHTAADSWNLPKSLPQAPGLRRYRSASKRPK